MREEVIQRVKFISYSSDRIPYDFSQEQVHAHHWHTSWRSWWVLIFSFCRMQRAVSHILKSLYKHIVWRGDGRIGNEYVSKGPNPGKAG